MDATTSITPAQVVALAEQISNGAKGIQQKLDDLDAKVNTLRASWDGAAQEAYDQAQLKWTKQLNDLNTLLAKIATTTVELSNGYVARDKASAGRGA